MMKQKVVFLIHLVLIIFLLQIIIQGQISSALKLVNNHEITVVDNVNQEITAIKISENEFEAILNSVGKSSSLNSDLLKKLKKKDKKIYHQVQKITTAFSFHQDQNRSILQDSEIAEAKSDVEFICLK